MSKILAAACDALGNVTIEGFPIPDAVVISEGKQASTGVAAVEKNQVTYIASSATDVKATIEKTVLVIDEVSDSLAKLVNIITALGAGMTGPTTSPPPSLTADLAEITTNVSDLATVKTALNQMKGALK